ncbi:hypothetical protein YC2023_122887 [Brassica napus]
MPRAEESPNAGTRVTHPPLLSSPPERHRFNSSPEIRPETSYRRKTHQTTTSLQRQRSPPAKKLVLAPPWWSRLETELFNGADAHPKVGHGQATVFGFGRQNKYACKFPGSQYESNPGLYLQLEAV